MFAVVVVGLDSPQWSFKRNVVFNNWMPNSRR